MAQIFKCLKLHDTNKTDTVVLFSQAKAWLNYFRNKSTHDMMNSDTWNSKLWIRK